MTLCPSWITRRPAGRRVRGGGYSGRWPRRGTGRARRRRRGRGPAGGEEVRLEREHQQRDDGEVPAADAEEDRGRDGHQTRRRASARATSTTSGADHEQHGDDEQRDDDHADLRRREETHVDEHQRGDGHHQRRRECASSDATPARTSARSRLAPPWARNTVKAAVTAGAQSGRRRASSGHDRAGSVVMSSARAAGRR